MAKFLPEVFPQSREKPENIHKIDNQPLEPDI
jgi:hypothetical protein